MVSCYMSMPVILNLLSRFVAFLITSRDKMVYLVDSGSKQSALSNLGLCRASLEKKTKKNRKDVTDEH